VQLLPGRVAESGGRQRRLEGSGYGRSVGKVSLLELSESKEGSAHVLCRKEGRDVIYGAFPVQLGGQAVAWQVVSA